MRLLGKIIATFIVLLALVSIVLLTLMHTRYATPIALQIINTFSPYSLTAKHVDYQIDTPLQLIIERPNLTITTDQPPLTAQRLILWLNLSTITQGRWQFDTILIDKPNLQDIANHSIPLPEIHSQRLAISNWTGSLDGITLSNGKIELDNWHFQPTDPRPLWQQFTGDFRLSADNLSGMDIQFEQVLLDGNHDNDHWTLYGGSAKWQQASLNGQLEYNASKHHLTLHQFTLTGLQLQSREALTPVQQTLQQLEHSGLSATVERLDILDSSLELPAVSLNHASLSLENWQWPQSVFAQTNAWLSFSADSGVGYQTAFSDPLLELTFAPQQININGASVNALEGYWRTDGALTPDSLLINNLTINGIKWLLPANEKTQIQQTASLFNQIAVRNLDIDYAQLTAANKNWPWQISGLNIRGHDLIIMRHGQPGLWQGSLVTSARLASLNKIELIDPLLEMQSSHGHWQLSQAIIPFKDGLLEGRGELDLGSDGMPWSITAEGDSLPTQILSQWLALPLPLAGYMDLKMHGNGLGQHRAGLAYSLDGALSATFRETSLTTPVATMWQQWEKGASPSNKTQPDMTDTSQTVALSPLMIHSDRGRISLTPQTLTHVGLKAKLEGKWDLARPSKQEIKLDATRGCQHLQRRWNGAQETLSVTPCEG